MDWRVALIQMEVVAGEKERNVQHAQHLIAEAAAQGAELVVLPETMDLGWTHPSCSTEAEPVPGGSVCRRLAESARRHNVFVCAGLTEEDRGQIFNSAVLLDPGGDLLGRHRKVNELDIAHHLYARGDRLGVVRTEPGAVGLLICADAFARGEVLSRSLGCMGADIILLPCAWAVDADHDNATQPYGETWLRCFVPVAREFGLWMIGVSNVGAMDAGPWAGKRCIGNSLVIGPDGSEAARGPYGVEAVLLVDIPHIS